MPIFIYLLHIITRIWWNCIIYLISIKFDSSEKVIWIVTIDEWEVILDKASSWNTFFMSRNMKYFVQFCFSYTKDY